MKKRIFLKEKFTAGFTLIELLVVIAIIGILAAIVIPNLNSARAKGRDARRISDLKSIQLALTTYFDTHRATGYPKDVDELYEQDVISPVYLSVMPTDPSSGLKYGYTYDGTIYCLGAHLEVAVPGDDSDCGINDNNEVWDDNINYTVQN